MRTRRLAAAALFCLLLTPAAGSAGERDQENTEGPILVGEGLAVESYDSPLESTTAEVRPISKPVTVTNFPAVQEVTGTVSVGNLPPAGGQGRQLVGFTQALVNGSVGIMAINAACDAEHEGSRWCTTEEMVEVATQLPLDLPVAAESAWVRPVFVPVAWSTSSPRVYDVTGMGMQADHAMCNARRSGTTSYRGLTVSREGLFAEATCNQELSLPCCR